MRVLLPGFIDRADVRLGNAIFNAYDRNGVAWVLTDMEGWWDIPDVTLPDDPRPFEHDGSYYTPGRYMPRVITLSGTLIPPSGIQQGLPLGDPATNYASWARQALGSAMDLVRKGATLQVDEEVPKQALVQLAARPSFRNSKINGAFDFQIPLKAGDPRKYAQTLTTISGIGMARSVSGRTYPRTYPMTYQTPGTQSTSLSLAYAANAGTYNTGAIIRIYGPVSTPQIEHIESGNRLRFHTDIATGDYLELDLLNRTALLNGTANRRATLEVRSHWFLLQPGVNTIRFNGSLTGEDAEPYMDIEYRSAWLY
jgi:hypothetical protein